MLAILTYNLLLATAMIAATVIFHFAGLLALTAAMARAARRLRATHSVLGQGASILMVVFAIFALHSVEIWAYAGAYLGLGAIRGLEPALYFSVVAFASIGFGDIVLNPHWRLLAAIEGVNGLILIGWSTAFLISVTTRMRLMEHKWGE